MRYTPKYLMHAGLGETGGRCRSCPYPQTFVFCSHCSCNQAWLGVFYFFLNSTGTRNPVAYFDLDFRIFLRTPEKPSNTSHILLLREVAAP